MSPLSLCYALSDQSFARTKSLGILHLSVQLAQQLARAITPEDRLVLLSNTSLDAHLVCTPGVVIEKHDDAAESRRGRLLWDQWGCGRAGERSGCDWLFLPKGFGSFVRRPQARVAAYVHDVMHEVYRRQWPGAFPAFEGWYFRRALRATLRQAEVIFTNTDFTRRELLRVARQMNVAAPRIVTAGIGFTPPGRELAEGERRGVLALTSAWPHKRSDLLLEHLTAWQIRTNFAEEIHLVGSLPPGVSLPPGSGWKHHPRLEEPSFQRMLQQNRAVVYLSSYEGFGMPPLEATLAGAAAVLSDLPSTREVMGPCGYFFQNESLDSFVGAMGAALQSPPETIRAWAGELLARHSWSEVIPRVLQELRG